MRTTLRLSFLLILSFGQIAAYSQDTTNMGKEFWVGYGHHQYMETGMNSQTMTLYISTNAQPATVTITIDSSGALPSPSTWWSRTYNIPANTVIDIVNTPATTFTSAAGAMGPIPTSGAHDARLFSDPPPVGPGSVGVFRRKGIHIQSDVPVVAYAHIYASVSSGATMLVPVTAWGGLYNSVNSEQVDGGGPAFSWMYVIAAYDNTLVEITPSVLTRSGHPAGVPFTVTLHKGQIYQLLGQADASGTGNNLIGTKIRSLTSPTGYIHPIGVFSGSSRTRGESVPCGTASGRDNDIQQHFPRQAWGKNYLLAPFVASNGLNMTCIYKITVSDPATIVSRNGAMLSGLITPGNYYKFSSNTAEYIQADQPIHLAQFMSGSASCNPGTYGDPEMVYLSPISQGTKQALFYRNDVQAINSNYLTLILPTVGLTSLTIDGQGHLVSPNTVTTPHPQLAGYTIVNKSWTAGKAQCFVQCDTTFTGITYGLGSAESYGYNIGSRLNAVNARDASVLPPGFTGVLPVTLLDFNAVKNASDVYLKWTTTHEINFDRFEVERSINATEFAKFVTVQAAQGGAYNTVDVNAIKLFATVPALYYRLKMIDKDGKFKYSGIVTVKNTPVAGMHMQVAPNPFADKMHIQLQTVTAGTANINIRDITGKLVLRQSRFVAAGSSVIELDALDELQAGIYIIEVEMNGSRQQLKAVKN